MCGWERRSSGRGAEMTIPEPALRLFPHCELAALETAPGFVTGRLLEDGDSADLAWLFAARGREAIRAWVARHGERQLSRRSLAFWRQRLGLGPAAASGAPGAAGGEWWRL